MMTSPKLRSEEFLGRRHNVQKTLIAVAISIVLLCGTFGAGYLTGHFRKDSNSSGSGSSYSEQIGRIVELTREYLVRERAGLEAERNLVREQRVQLEADRAVLKRERDLFNRQREAARTDRGDLKELTEVLNKIRVMAQDKE